MKRLLIIICITCCFSSYAQTNLLDISTWTVGSGSVTGFTKSGINEKNIRQLGVTPYGTSNVLWTMIPDANDVHDGGWETSSIAITHSKSYRLTLWIKKENSQDGHNYIGFRAFDAQNNIANSDLTVPNVNPYFFTGDVPQLNQWYLLVAYVHQSGYTSTTDIGGVYNLNGEKVANAKDFKFITSSETLKYRASLKYDTNTNDRQYFFAPTIYEINGLEPTIAELISPNTTPVDSTSPSIPTGLASSNIAATTATLSWSVSTDNIGVTAYEVFKNNNLETTVTSGTSYAITGLTAATAYTYTIKAKDAAGNTSVQSTSLTITTLGSGGTPTTGGHWTKTGAVVSYAGGKVGIGTTSPDYELTVKGKIHAEEVKIDLTVPAPDYVFKKEYKLLTLEEVQNYITKNGHLPNIPSAKVMETEGVALGAMEMKLLEKIEELTLYTIELKKQAMEQKKQHQKKDTILLTMQRQLKIQELRIKKLETVNN